MKLTRYFQSLAGSTVASDKAFQLSLKGGLRLLTLGGELLAQIVVGSRGDDSKARTKTKTDNQSVILNPILLTSKELSTGVRSFCQRRGCHTHQQQNPNRPWVGTRQS